MSRTRPFLILLALASVAACDRYDPATAPLRVSPPHAVLAANVITVTNTNDAGDGSLRAAIAAAQAGDVIHFDAAIAGQTITLTTGEFEIDKALTIEGPAAAGMTISGGGVSRIAHVGVTGDLTLRNLTIKDGFAGVGTLGGGGLSNFGKLTIEHSTVMNNTIDWLNLAAQGGGIFNFTGAVLTVLNSTVSGNFARVAGGGIMSRGTATLIHTTIANNSAPSSGGGLGADGTLTIRNSIIANNSSNASQKDCNILGPTTLTLSGTSIAGTADCITDPKVIVGDPLLGALANNGGPTKTHALLVNSPAIDVLADCITAEDQRHVVRPQGPACDIGAYEFTEYVKTPIAVDAGVAVNPSNGVAIVTGSMTCSSPINIPLHLVLTQVQKNGRATVTAVASGDIVVNCTSVKAWSISLAPPTGAFQNSAGTVAASTTPPNSSVAPASANAVVKLYWGRKG